MLKGNVNIDQGDRELHANTIYLYRNEAGKVDEAELVDKVSLREPGKLFLGDWAWINLSKQTAKIDHVLYRLAFTKDMKKKSFALAHPDEIMATANVPRKTTNVHTEQIASEHPLVRLDQLNAWGYADHVEQIKPTIIKLENASYSTCPPNDPLWQLKASDIELNRDTGRGEATHIRLNLNDVPILYLPYFNFPIDNRRKSGFLFPSLGYASDSGTELAVPYYFNLAPNYDAIFMPRIFSERGLQLNGQFRYMNKSHNLNFQIDYLPSDRKFSAFQKQAAIDFSEEAALVKRLNNESNDRRFIAFKDHSTFNAHWQFMADFNWVGDDYYFQDLGTDFNAANTNQLNQEIKVTYQGRNWDFIGRVQEHQTLHQVNQAPINEIYSRLPQLYLTAEYPNQWAGIDLHWVSEFVNFKIRHNPGDPFTRVTGQRVFLQPGISQPYYFSGGYIKPSFYLRNVTYALQNPDGRPTNPNRSFPIFNIDSGVTFKRDFSLFARDYSQSLEPRLFYLFVPYVKQSDLPDFDTTIQPFNYEHLFRLNRFDGFDRMNDANQLSYAMTTRLVDHKTGDEKLRASIGQIFYFRNRNVQLCGQANCQDQLNPTLAAVTETNNNFSPLVGEINYHLQKSWWLRTAWAYDVKTGQVNNGNFFVQYIPKPNKILNLGYVFIRDGDEISPLLGRPDLSQADISFAWPVNDRWSVLGRWNYNIGQQRMNTYIAGLQYDNCCWATRLVASRRFKNLDENDNPQYDTVYYVQWLLKGLGSLGSGDPGNLLLQGIPEYKDPFKG